MGKKKTAPTAKISNEELAVKALHYVKLKDDEKTLKSEMTEARTDLEIAVSTDGRVLPNGSKLLVIPYAGQDVHIEHQLRVGKVLLADAFDVLKANKLEECIENIPTIREDRLKLMYENGQIPDDVMKQIYGPKETWAFSVKVKPHVEITDAEGREEV